MLLWGEKQDTIWRSRLQAWSLSICPSGLVGWARDDGGPGGRGEVLAGWGEDCGRLGEGDASSIFIPDTERTVNEVAFVIKAVYQLGNLQKLSAREPMLGSGAVCIDLPSRLNCARCCRKEPRVPVSCVMLCEDTGDVETFCSSISWEKSLHDLESVAHDGVC